MSARCQGCGTPEGEVVVPFHTRSPHHGERCRVAEGNGPAVLTEVDLGGWPRLLCHVCRRHAVALTGDLQMFGLARPQRQKPTEPDPRQLVLGGGEPA